MNLALMVVKYVINVMNNAKHALDLILINVYHANYQVFLTKLVINAKDYVLMIKSI